MGNFIFFVDYENEIGFHSPLHSEFIMIDSMCIILPLVALVTTYNYMARECLHSS